jgi:hypothetical protein
LEWQSDMRLYTSYYLYYPLLPRPESGARCYLCPGAW